MEALTEVARHPDALNGPTAPDANLITGHGQPQT